MHISSGPHGSFLGSIDEIRVSSVARSADWIATEYYNECSPQTFYSVSYELPPPLAAFATTFTEDGGSVAIADTDALLSDLDDSNLISLSVTITNQMDGADEVLSADTAGTGIFASYDSSTGLLTLSGVDTVDHYQQVLRTVTYNNTSQDPDITTREITFVAHDGTGYSNVATATVTMVAQNDPPVMAGIEAVALAYTENDGAVAIAPSITASDVDDTDIESAVIQLTSNYTSGEDVLAFANTANITGSWDAGSGTLTLTGSDTLANYQTALRRVTYQNTSDNPSTATRTVAFTVHDGDANSNTQTREITIAAINDPPAITPALDATIRRSWLALHGEGSSVGEVMDAAGHALDPAGRNRAPDAAARLAPALAYVHGWNTNQRGVPQSAAEPWLVDESFVSASLTEAAVPVAMFHKVAGQWQRQAVESPGSQPQAGSAAANARNVEPVLIGRMLDKLVDDSQLDDVDLKLCWDSRSGRLDPVGGLCHLDLAGPSPVGESASAAARLDTARSASNGETQGHRR